MPGPVRKEMQFRQPGDFSKIHVSALTIRYKYFRIFPVHLQIAFWNDFLYHLILSLYLVNICMTGVYSGIQWNIYVKHFNIPPPLPFSPSLRSRHRTNLGTWRPKYTLNPFFSKLPNKSIINISYRISPIGFYIVKAHNYLGLKPPKICNLWNLISFPLILLT